VTPPNRALHYGLGMEGYLDWKTYQEQINH
jgi:hypothetical protein